MRDLGVDPARLKVALTRPSNEAVITAVESGSGATAVSQFAVSSLIAQGLLARVGFPIPPRKFMVLPHKERQQTKSSLALEKLCLAKMKIGA